MIVERDKSQVNDWHRGKSTPLHLAANNDHDECIRVLVLLVRNWLLAGLGLLAAWACLHDDVLGLA